MIKILGNFVPYGEEFITTYPHLVDRLKSDRLSKDVEFTKLLDSNTKQPSNQEYQRQQGCYELSSTSLPLLSTTSAPHQKQSHSTPHSLYTLPTITSVDEELFVQDSTVIWSRGRHIIKTFQYEMQTVERALFVWFPVDHSCIDDCELSLSTSKTSDAKEKQPLKEKRRSIAALTDSSNQQQDEVPSGGHTLPAIAATLEEPVLEEKDRGGVAAATAASIVTEEMQDKEKEVKAKIPQQKSVCIILKDCLKIHFMDGKHYSINLPFSIQHVIPSDIGLILERANNSIHHNKKPNTAGGSQINIDHSMAPAQSSSGNQLSLSPFLYLRHPTEEFKPMFFQEELSLLPYGSNNGDMLMNDIFQQQELVYATLSANHLSHKNIHRSPTLVVTRSRDTGLHCIWRHQLTNNKGRNQQTDMSDDDLSEEESKSFFRKMPSLQMDQQPKKIERQIRAGRKPHFQLKGGKKKRQRRQQEKQPLSPSSSFLHSPSPTPSLTTRKDSFLAASWSFIHNDDDPSDAMPGGDSGLNMATLYQDALLDDNNEKSQLQFLWREQSRSHINPKTISKAFIAHDGKGQDVLCIMNETQGMLTGLVIKDLLAKKEAKRIQVQVTGFQLAVKQALPMYHVTRSDDAADILLLDHQNNLSLFIDPQLPCLPVLLPTDRREHVNLPDNDKDVLLTNMEQRIIKIQHPVDNRFNIVIKKSGSDGSPCQIVKRCQLDFATAGTPYHQVTHHMLVANSNMALRCAWSFSFLWFHFQYHLLQLLQCRQQERGQQAQHQQQELCGNHEWEAFVITLFSMIPLSRYSSSVTPSMLDNPQIEVCKFYFKCMKQAYNKQHERQNNLHIITHPRDLASMVHALHVLYQEYNLSKFFPKKIKQLLGTLLWLLSKLARSKPWSLFYQQYGTIQDLPFSLDTDSMIQESNTTSEGNAILPDHPFDFESWVRYRLPQRRHSVTLEQLSGMRTLYPAVTAVSSPRQQNIRNNTFGYKLKMIWYIHQTMHHYLRNTGNKYSTFFPLTSAAEQSTTLSTKLGIQGWVKAVVDKGYCRNDLDMVSESCQLLDPLLDALAYLQLSQPAGQSVDFYSFIGRYDMVAQLDQLFSSTRSNTTSLSTYDLKLLRFSMNEKMDRPQNVHQLMMSADTATLQNSLSLNTTQKQADASVSSSCSDLVLSQLFYGGGASSLDKLKHVRTTLNPCRLVEITIADRPDIPNENDINLEYQGHMKHLIQRTLALSIGNGIFHYGHHHLFQPSMPNAGASSVTQTSFTTHINMNNNMNTGGNMNNANTSDNSNNETGAGNGNRTLAMIEEKINLSVKLLPLRTVITLDEKQYRPEYFDWPRFHHGVATGLRLSSPRNQNNDMKDGTPLMLSSKNRHKLYQSTNTSQLDDGLFSDGKNNLHWLFYMEPENLNVFHGGILFGLGLNGHLLPDLHWYRYITQTKCSLVTIGFILGTSVTLRGTRNPEITRLLSIHVPALLAPTAPTAAATTSAAAATVTSGGATGMASHGAGGLSSIPSHCIPGGDDLMSSSCLFGLGLIYMGSCDRCMTSVMLNEIGNCSKRANSGYGSVSNEDMSVPGIAGGNGSNNSKESACALAAGFALGFIVLGKGGNASKELGGLSDLQLSDTLHYYMTGQALSTNSSKTPGSGSILSSAPTVSEGIALALERDQHRHPSRQKQKQGQASQRQHYPRGMSNLLDITAPAATVAFGLIYLKTENHRMADRVDVCETTKPYLNYVRPDFLLMRVVAKNLILWKSITPTEDWIQHQMPAFMRLSQDKENADSTGHTRLGGTSTLAWEDQVVNQAKYNIIAGACLCIGLRFAGSHHSKAFKCLLEQLDIFMKLGASQATSFQEHITRNAVWICVDVIATAAAMVMAGSGHEELYERLKLLHQRVPFGRSDTTASANLSNAIPAMGYGTYGNHMASHMAMGLLFCGLGRYTLKTSNDAIAGLLCAFYPFYPINPEDQRSHLQAFRHLWVMSLDQRWLTPFDCETKQPCQVPLILTTTASSSESEEVTSVEGTKVDTVKNVKEKDDSNNHTEGYQTGRMKQDGDSITGDKWKQSDQQQQQQEQPIQRRVIAPSVVPNYESLQTIQLDSSLYYPLTVNMQTKNDYQQAICQSGILFVQRRKGNQPVIS